MAYLVEKELIRQDFSKRVEFELFDHCIQKIPRDNIRDSLGEAVISGKKNDWEFFFYRFGLSETSAELGHLYYVAHFFGFFELFKL